MEKLWAGLKDNNRLIIRRKRALKFNEAVMVVGVDMSLRFTIEKMRSATNCVNTCSTEHAFTAFYYR